MDAASVRVDLQTSFPPVHTYWQLVVQRLECIEGIEVKLDPDTCLLGMVRKCKGRKMEWKFIQLTLLLDKRWAAISWISPLEPREQGWIKDITKWAVAEEVWLHQCRRDNHAEKNLRTWSGIHTRVGEVEEGSADDRQGSEG